MATVSVEVTAVVVTENVAEVLPAGTVTVAGTFARVLLLDSAIEISPVGAAALNVTVPVDKLPPITEPGLSETEESAITGVMTTEAVLFTPLREAVMVAVVGEVTAVVVTVNTAVAAPEGTVTPVGTVADVLLLSSVTRMPPGGAVVLRVTDPVDGLPPVMETGFIDAESSATGGVMVRLVTSFRPS